MLGRGLKTWFHMHARMICTAKVQELTARHLPGPREALRGLGVCGVEDLPPKTAVVTTTNAAPRPRWKAASEGGIPAP